MNDDTKVLIIVPIYNAEKYLYQCVDSILKQSYKNFELTLINDGSTDCSGKICDEYAKMDDRVNVIHKMNGGVSSARNAGLKKAQGGGYKYVLFIDSDDFVDFDYIETLIGHSNGFDAVGSGWRKFEGNEEKIVSLKSYKYLGNENIKRGYFEGPIHKVFLTPWGILYRASALKNILFDEQLIIAEDVVFNLNFLAQAHSVYLIGYCGYNLRSHTNSTTKRVDYRYTPIYEHNYITIDKIKDDAKRNWGFDETTLERDRQSKMPQRYYHEMTNLLRPGSPYTKSEIKEKIREINEDEKFVGSIKRKPFSELSSAGKISKLSVFLKLPILQYRLYWLILKLKREL